MVERTYTTADLIRITGITKRQLARLLYQATDKIVPLNAVRSSGRPLQFGPDALDACRAYCARQPRTEAERFRAALREVAEVVRACAPTRWRRVRWPTSWTAPTGASCVCSGRNPPMAERWPSAAKVLVPGVQGAYMLPWAGIIFDARWAILWGCDCRHPDRDSAVACARATLEAHHG